jgi:polar amino acid transport system permease protein
LLHQLEGWIVLELFSFGDTGWGDELLAGFGTTIALAAVTLPIGILLGFLIAMASMSKSPVLRWFGIGYTTIFRGIPELLTLFTVYNGAALILNRIAAWANPEGGFVELSPFVAGVVALGLVFGAFAAEVLRGAFQALDKGQIEAGLAVGMKRSEVFRRIKLPQVWRFALPGLGNLWVNLIKDTALVSIISLNDLMRMTQVAVGFTKLPFTFYLAACLAYWAVCALSEVGAAKLETRANRGIRRA